MEKYKLKCCVDGHQAAPFVEYGAPDSEEVGLETHVSHFLRASCGCIVELVEIIPWEDPT